jgi:hypothetical protein
VTDNMICLLARDAQPAVPAYSSPAARLLRSKSRAGVRNPLNRDVPPLTREAPTGRDLFGKKTRKSAQTRNSNVRKSDSQNFHRLETRERMLGGRLEAVRNRAGSLEPKWLLCRRIRVLAEGALNAEQPMDTGRSEAEQRSVGWRRRNRAMHRIGYPRHAGCVRTRRATGPDPVIANVRP